MRWLVFALVCCTVMGAGALINVPALMIAGFVLGLPCYGLSLYTLGREEEQVSHATVEDFDSIEFRWPEDRRAA